MSSRQPTRCRPARAVLLALAILTLVSAGRVVTAAESVLNIYNWADYIDPALIEEFEREFGIKVNYDIYDSSEIVDTKLLTGHSGYDLVFHAASNSARLIPIGVYHSVDVSRLQNWHHIDPDLVARIQSHYGEQIAGVPYMWGTTGFAYNREMVLERMPEAPLDSAALVFDPAIVSRFADCGVSLLDGPTSVIPSAMLYLGHPPNSVEPQHLHEAELLLRAVRPYIKYFSSTKMLLDLPSEEVCIAMAWSGDYSIAASRAEEAGVNIELGYSVPSEGTTAWYDLMYIPADAPHPDNAYLFLDFVLRPQVIARASNYIGYANANRSATALVDPTISADPAIYPDQQTLERVHPIIVLPPKLERRRSRTWTKIKTGL
jgi:putrescine transport system substrate-binding protein